MKSLKLRDDFYWVGVLDSDLRVFDIIMYTEFGTTYNSYLLKTKDKVVLFETVKVKYFDEYIQKLRDIIKIEDIDYLVVSHTEPDHSGSIEKLLELNTNLKIIASSVSVTFLREIVNKEFQFLAVKDLQEIKIGDKTLVFYSVPNLHWPDTIFTYIKEEKILVTCDSFGSHYSFSELLQSKVTQYDDYLKATKYYFDMIIKPFSGFMLKAIQKIQDLSLDYICPGHGPVIDQKISEFIQMYQEWSTILNPNLKKTVVIPYVSSYGYTGELAHKIKEGIVSCGEIDVKIYDMVLANREEVLNEIFFADGLLFGTPTILQEALKPIWDLVTSIYPVTHMKKLASSFGSYGWSGEGVDNIIERLKQLKMNVLEGFKVRFKPNSQNLKDAIEFGVNFGNQLLGKKEEKKERKKMYKCLVCGETFDQSHDICPICGVGKENFVVIEEEDLVKVNKAMNIVIIGAGIAGVQTAIELRKRNDLAKIYLISKEKYLPYNRTLLTKDLANDFNHIELKDFSFYEEQNIHLLLGKEAIDINDQQKEVTLDDFTSIVYDSLVFANGSRNLVLKSGNFDSQKIFTIRTVDDIKALKAHLKDVKDVAIIGAGVLGLELASELKKYDLKVSLIEKRTHILEPEFDHYSATLLKEILNEKEIDYYEDTYVEEFNKDSLILNNKEVVKADLLIYSIGIIPNTELAKKIGLHINRGIVVNDYLEAKNHIYAAGDICELNGKVVGLWNNAIDMAKNVSANILGDKKIFKRDLYPLTFSIFGQNFYSLGKITDDYVLFGNEKDRKYRKLFFEKDQLVGCVLINESDKIVEAFEMVKQNKLKKEILQ